jgi:hypothetical protein
MSDETGVFYFHPNAKNEFQVTLNDIKAQIPMTETAPLRNIDVFMGIHVRVRKGSGKSKSTMGDHTSVVKVSHDMYI